jgi:S-DNA-T family DNA segregation ATPase FtsK/SpoIIIE
MAYADNFKEIFTGELPEFPQGDVSARIASFFGANGVGLRVLGVEHGPVVTKYACELESDTDRVSKVEALRRDLGLRLGVGASRVYIGETMWEGRVALAIEVPNADRIPVPSGAVVPMAGRGDGLRVCLGVDTSGRPYSVDLSRAPHVLVAGQSGSGKSVFINSLICGLSANYSPAEARVAIVDPKGTEFNRFAGNPSVYDFGLPGGGEGSRILYSEHCVGLVEAAVEEMGRRMAMFKDAGASSLAEYNASGEYGIPYLVIVIDEFYDLMMNYGDAFSGPLSVLAAKARSAGIHLVLATQRPSADVIKGALKANLSTRIALKVASRTDSQVIIDRPGAESLCGKGDMLYCGPDGDVPLRLHGCMLTGDEVSSCTAKAIELAGA